MAIERYAIASFCGYGVWQRKNDYDYYKTDVPIVARSPKTTECRTTVEGFPSEIRGVSLIINGESCVQPLFVVLESKSKIWKEYFSGLEIPTHSYFLNSHEINVDNYEERSLCRRLTMGSFQDCKAIDFEAKVSQYTEQQIKDMVNQLYVMQDQAKKWSSAIDQAFQRVKEERRQKELGASEIASKLESGFGKYRNSVNNSEKRTEPKKPVSDKDVILWMREKRCSFCGGEFKGLFTKTCKECGREKDY